MSSDKGEAKANSVSQLIKIVLISLGSALSITGFSINLFIEPGLDLTALGGLIAATVGTFLVGYLLASYQCNIDPIQREKAKAMRELRRLLNTATELRLGSSASVSGLPNPFDNGLLAVLKKMRDLALQAGNRELAESYEKEIAEVERRVNQNYELEAIGFDVKNLPLESSKKEAIDSKQVNLVYEVIKQLVRENGAADLESIIRRIYKISKMNDIMVLQVLDKLINDGRIYETIKGHYKIIENVNTDKQE